MTPGRPLAFGWLSEWASSMLNFNITFLVAFHHWHSERAFPPVFLLIPLNQLIHPKQISAP